MESNDNEWVFLEELELHNRGDDRGFVEKSVEQVIEEAEGEQDLTEDEEVSDTEALSEGNGALMEELDREFANHRLVLVHHDQVEHTVKDVFLDQDFFCHGSCWLNAKLTLTVGQLLILLLGNCFLSMLSYGMVFQFSNFTTFTSSYPWKGAAMAVLHLPKHPSKQLEEEAVDEEGGLFDCKCVCRPVLAEGNATSSSGALAPFLWEGKVAGVRESAREIASTSERDEKTCAVEGSSLLELPASTVKAHTSTKRSSQMRLKELQQQLRACEEESEFWFERYSEAWSKAGNRFALVPRALMTC
ncbi:hypothetical protein HOP50_01g09520 [Chloropicon primus]|nr:hypothetical protein HOP50_01g09520 [Chloropicon primus]|mmetsp:Transcript_7120/g.20766  ORF Transcript_7120/g.20766 Transcript_7120/m.20766 type:complete len:302 (-) Transcript_7120:45-950(-)